MAYLIGIFCDGCKDGCVGVWENHTVTKSVATRIARDHGWSVGKNGWLCPTCRKKIHNTLPISDKHN